MYMYTFKRSLRTSKIQIHKDTDKKVSLQTCLQEWIDTGQENVKIEFRWKANEQQYRAEEDGRNL